MKILVARDEAFNFTYRANIDWLRKVGDVRFFSPCGPTPSPSLLRRGVECSVDDELLGNDDEWLDNITVVNLLRTGNVDLLYLPGGYPELFAKQLEENAAMRHAIRKFAEAGGRIFAECGGFMYLCTAIDDVEMCGVLPIKATMEGARLHLGYRQMEWNGVVMKGHEFHYSSILDIDASMSTGEAESQVPTGEAESQVPTGEAESQVPTGEAESQVPTREAEGAVLTGLRVLRLQRTAAGREVDTPIYRYRNVVAGYTHWYWADKEIEDFVGFWK